MACGQPPEHDADHGEADERAPQQNQAPGKESHLIHSTQEVFGSALREQSSITAPSQKLEPPTNPGRFMPTIALDPTRLPPDLFNRIGHGQTLQRGAANV